MEITLATIGFSAMGSEPRLSVLQCLVKAGKQGLSVGEIQERTKIPGSTLAHHLKALEGASLILQKKQGRTIFNHANYAHLESLANYILDEWCIDEGNGHD